MLFVLLEMMVIQILLGNKRARPIALVEGYRVRGLWLYSLTFGGCSDGHKQCRIISS